MNLLLLLTAALSYSIGGYFMKLSDGLTKGGPTAVVLALFCFGAVLQTIAMRHMEMTATYIIVLGLEAVTALLLGLFLLGETISLLKLFGILLVAGGVALLRLP
ncbi:MAG: SMR family transporter [Caldilineaceae bacterium]